MVQCVLSSQQLLSLLPHRGHALFVTEAQVDNRNVSGTASWSADHPHLTGHFPGMPIVPGVYLVEAAAQLAGVAISCESNDLVNGKIGVLASVRKTHFHRFVHAGQPVIYQLQVQPVAASGMYIASGTASVAGHKVLTVDLTIAAVARTELTEAA